jgi:hypothetical protein
MAELVAVVIAALSLLAALIVWMVTTVGGGRIGGGRIGGATKTDKPHASRPLALLNGQFPMVAPDTRRRAASAIETLVALSDGPFKTEMDTITDESPRLPYESILAPRGTIHSGQRKLLIALLDALADHVPAGSRAVVVYVGAAPGVNIGFVADLFPTVRFDLFDPNPFDARLVAKAAAEPDRVCLFSQYFTDEDTARYAAAALAEPIIFISDIRGGDGVNDIRQMTPAVSNRYVDDDMRMQERWVRKIRPAAYSLKFRLPYPTPGAGAAPTASTAPTAPTAPIGAIAAIGTAPYPYLGGRIRIQSWPGSASSETRLVGTAADAAAPPVEYNVRDYEDRCFFHNFVTRVFARYSYDGIAPGGLAVGEPGDAPATLADNADRAAYGAAARYAAATAPGVAPARGLCRCFDCANEVDTWRRYFARPDAVWFELPRGDVAGAIAASVTAVGSLGTTAGLQIKKNGHGLRPNSPVLDAIGDIWQAAAPAWRHDQAMYKTKQRRAAGIGQQSKSMNEPSG